MAELPDPRRDSHANRRGRRIEYRIRGARLEAALGDPNRPVGWPPTDSRTSRSGPVPDLDHRTVSTPAPRACVSWKTTSGTSCRSGVLGRLAHALRVRRQLEEIFEYRAKRRSRRSSAAAKRRAAPVSTIVHWFRRDLRVRATTRRSFRGRSRRGRASSRSSCSTTTTATRPRDVGPARLPISRESLEELAGTLARGAAGSSSARARFRGPPELSRRRAPRPSTRTRRSGRIPRSRDAAAARGALAGGARLRLFPDCAPRRARKDGVRRRRAVHGLLAVRPPMGGDEKLPPAGARQPRRPPLFAPFRSLGSCAWRDSARIRALAARGRRRGRRLLTRFANAARSYGRIAIVRSCRGPRGCLPTSISGRFRRGRCAAGLRGCRESPREARPSFGSSRGGTSSTHCSSTSLAWPRELSPELDGLAWRDDPRDCAWSAERRDIRSSTPRCASSRRRTGCTTARGWSSASFLTKDLHVHWREGQAWFEHELADATRRTTTAAGSGRRAPGRTPRRISGSSIPSCSRSASTRRGSTSAGTSRPSRASPMPGSTSRGPCRPPSRTLRLPDRTRLSRADRRSRGGETCGARHVGSDKERGVNEPLAPFLEFRPEGLRAPAFGAWIDPASACPRAILSHAHADHAAAGHGEVWATPQTSPSIGGGIRTGRGVARPLGYGERIPGDGAQLTLLSAGHMLGSAQVRIEVEERSLLYTGDSAAESRTAAPAVAAPAPCSSRRRRSAFRSSGFRGRWRSRPGSSTACRAALAAGDTSGRPRVRARQVPGGRAVLTEAGIPTVAPRAAWKLLPEYEAAGSRVSRSRVPTTAVRRGPARPSSRHPTARAPSVRKLKRRRVIYLSGWAVREASRAEHDADVLSLVGPRGFRRAPRHVGSVAPQRVFTLHGFARTSRGSSSRAASPPSPLRDRRGERRLRRPDGAHDALPHARGGPRGGRLTRAAGSRRSAILAEALRAVGSEELGRGARLLSGSPFAEWEQAVTSVGWATVVKAAARGHGLGPGNDRRLAAAIGDLGEAVSLLCRRAPESGLALSARRTPSSASISGARASARSGARCSRRLLRRSSARRGEVPA